MNVMEKVLSDKKVPYTSKFHREWKMDPVYVFLVREMWVNVVDHLEIFTCS
jgi:hypothetical protein